MQHISNAIYSLSHSQDTRVPCEHEFCQICLDRLFQVASENELQFPPRCCRQEIPLEPNEKFLSPWVIRHFRVKAAEFTDPKRTYCHRPTCSAFIPAFLCKSNLAQCQVCFARTCTFCKGKYHNGDCPFDKGLLQVLKLAKKEGWRQCPECKTMIERNNGCEHMT
ncbi:hypothetical protein F4805DRAFT_467167 [Annulohypoxylon moriforme]|nr:hypothetical protein F4805DRAFT_467167 [Annulohypoxylon moriforme]